MDEHTLSLNKGDNLPESDKVYRIVLIKDRDKKNKNIPAVRCFSLSKNDEHKLSVDWNKMTSPEESLARFGASFKFGTEEYKPYENRETHALDVSFLNSLSKVEKVVYDPLFFDTTLKGRINNPAHSLIVFEQEYDNDPEILLKMRDHASNNKIQIDMQKVDKLVKIYRERQN